MNIAVFSHTPLKREVVKGSKSYALTDLLKTMLEAYDAIAVIGSPSLEVQTELTNEETAALWHYVSQGGKLYVELVAAFDFPTSRLTGWKQDFRKSRRTLEKLRTTAAANLAIPAGSILEWEGALAHGFAFYGDVWLEFGPFKETHVSAIGSVRDHDHDRDHDKPSTTIKRYPALAIRSLDKGLVVNANFALFSNEETTALRPHARWSEVISALSGRTGIPFAMWPQVLQNTESASPEQAVHRSIDWFVQSGMLPQPDGLQGVYENIHSVTASVSYDRRPDCHAHTALMFYLYGKSSGKQEWIDASHGLLQSLVDGGYQDLDPNSPSYGFYKWYQYPGEKPHQIFTDDNAWVCLVLLYLYRQTGKEEYRTKGMLVAEGLLATQNKTGVRANVVTDIQLGEMGRERIAAELKPSMNPHFESIAHAAFIQAYLVTGEQEYLDTAIRGSIYLLEHIDELKFMYSRTSGYGRFILPLAYLRKHDPSGTISAGLAKVTDYLLSWQHPSGGIQEADNPDPDRFGQEDAGVYIHNGEGIADQLYTNNFLLMNVWEAWKATGEAKYEKLYRELSEYLCRIQISSPDPRFNGGWMRAYDLGLGEYFGNNGDTGWGPYCMESGWTNAMIPTGLLLGFLNESIFE